MKIKNIRRKVGEQRGDRHQYNVMQLQHDSRHWLVDAQQGARNEQDRKIFI